MVTPYELHQHVRLSLNDIIAARFADGLRAVLESGSAEIFLTNLLFMQLRAESFAVTREWPLVEGKRAAADLVLHGGYNTFLEVKQLHLKDGCRFAPPNLARDLRRHGPAHAMGILYVLDERASATARQFTPFKNRNRTRADKSEAPLLQVLAGLQATFEGVAPASLAAARVRHFDGDRGLDVYAFVVERTRAGEGTG